MTTSNPKHVLPVPEIPDAIIEAANNNELVLFIGAGVSRLIGCDGWGSLAWELLKSCFKNNYLTFKEKESLKNNGDHKKLITICYHIFKKNDNETEFFDIMKKSLKETAEEKEKIKEPNIYDEISRMKGIYVTTNADTHFERLVHNPYYQIDDLNIENINRSKLFQIHGSIKDPETLVFTVPQYFARYSHKPFKQFLSHIFDTKTVLFLGYGIAEFEVLDFILQGKKELKHYYLSPFYEADQNLLNFESMYYKDLGITLIGYSKDKNGYNQLNTVITEWAKKINQLSTVTHQNLSFYDDAIKSPTVENIDLALSYMKSDISLQGMFFKKISQTSNPIPWFYPLKNQGYFNSDKNPTRVDSTLEDGRVSYYFPHWNILDVLENIARVNTSDFNIEIQIELIKIVDALIDSTNRNERTDWKLVEIVSYFPVDYIKEKHIRFFSTQLTDEHNTLLIHAVSSKLIPHLLLVNGTSNLLLILKVFLGFKPRENKNRPNIQLYELQEFLKRYNEDIITSGGLELLQLLLGILDEIVLSNGDKLDKMWISTISENTNNSNEYEYEIVCLIRDSLQKFAPSLIYDIVSELFKKEHSIYKRIAIQSASFHFSDLSELFFLINFNPLDSDTRNETLILIKENKENLNDDMIAQIINWVETQEYKYLKDSDTSIAYKARFNKEVISLLIPTDNVQVNTLYEKYHLIYPEDIDPFWFLQPMTTQFGFAKRISPIPESTLITLSNEELVKRIKEDKTSTKTNWDDFTKCDLPFSIQKHITENADSISSMSLTPFLDLSPEFQYHILRGFEDAWRNNVDFSWEKLINFMHDLLTILDSNPSCHVDKETIDHNYQIKGVIADIISAGCRKDNHSFDYSIVMNVKELVFDLVSYIDDINHQKSIGNEPVLNALNSTHGKIYSSLMLLSLYIARNNPNEEDGKWDKDLRESFLNLLSKNDVHFFCIIGQYLPNLFYLDETWVIENLDQIFNTQNIEHWDAVMTGYINPSTTVYQNIYTKLNQQYHFSLTHEFANSHTKEKIIQHILLAYFENWESIDDPTGVFYELLIRITNDELSELVRFVQKSNFLSEPKYYENLVLLWDRLLFITNEKNLLEIRSSLGLWGNHLSEIKSSDYDRLLQSAGVIQKKWNDTRFIKILKEHVEKTPAYVGDIYKKMLENATPTYDQKDIVYIVETLYLKGEKNLANTICNEYLNKECEFLKDLFEKYNSDDGWN